ncbi:Drebrin-like protein [Aphelenchoides besseyi]|nr:Drebrin-like protein [Aphelenchoides besseyi]
MTCNLVNNETALLEAFDSVCESTDEWAIFEYEPNSNIVKLGESGTDGLQELLQNFEPSKVQYGFTSVSSADKKQRKIVLIHWQGEAVPAVRLAHTASHVEEIRRFVRRVNSTIYARNIEDLDLESIRKKLNLMSSIGPQQTQKPVPFVPPTPVGSVYKPVKDDLQLSEREKFWQKMRAEEEDRRKEEAKRREEQQKQFHMERKLLEKELHDAHLNSAVRAAQKAAEQQPPPKCMPKPAAKKTLVGGRAAMFEEEIAKIASSTATPTRPKEFKFQVGVQSKTTSIPVNSSAYIDDEANFVPVIEDPAKPVAKVTPQHQSIETSTQQSTELPEEPLKEKTTVPHEGERRAITIWSYDADGDDELTFESNDLIVEIEQLYDGWWRGRSSTGKVGLFPSNYVKLL